VDRELAAGLAVISVMWVNNETGVMQPIDDLAARAAAAGVPFHTDAVQTLGKVPCSFANPDITMFALSGHKIWAPQGTGVLLVRDRTAIEPLFHGGGQQAGLRPGTENVAGSVAMATAVALAVQEADAAAAHTRTLRDDLERRLAERLPDIVVHGRGAERAPHISNVSIPEADSDSLLMHLDLAGIACSSGSACLSGSFVASHVLASMGVEPPLAGGSLRFSFAKANAAADVDRVVEVLPDIVTTVRDLGSRLAS
jgi:cysteine desulfurase